MNKVHFYNDGELCLDALKIMGVSVKETDNPIGRFGTGLKYAIAVLLRERHNVTIKTGGKKYVFSIRDKSIRNRDFGVVFMNEEQMPFTIDFGKDWEIWQAFRELYSNVIDEDGSVTNQPVEADTVITVEGEKFHKAYLQKDDIFLRGEPLAVIPNILEIHHGSSNYCYYRNVRAMKTEIPTLFKYNFLTELDLTEDRTIKYPYQVNNLLGHNLPTLENEIIVSTLLNPLQDHDNVYELRDVDYRDAHSPSKVFIERLKNVVKLPNANTSFRQMYDVHAKEDAMETIKLTDYQKELVNEAFAILEKLAVTTIKMSDINRVETLGDNVLACYNHQLDKMYFSDRCFDMGAQQLAVTIYEEWLHKQHNLKDYSHGMQEFLINKIFSLIGEHIPNRQRT